MKVTIATIITTMLLGIAMGQQVRRRTLAINASADNEQMSSTTETEGLIFKATNQSITEGDNPLTRRRTASCQSFTGYVFWPSYDSQGYDIGQYNPATTTLASMISSCSSNSNCKGLNSNGYYKSSIQPLRLWYQWTSDPCKGLYIKSPTSFKVNGYTLRSNELKYLKWIAQWTVPNFGMSRYSAIKDYLAVGTWWTLREQVLMMANPWNHSLCQGKATPLGPLETCQAPTWQVGIAAVQVPNWRSQVSQVEARATSVYNTDVATVLGKSAQQAGYGIGTTMYSSITKATGDTKLAWLLKSHLVGFYMSAQDINWGCVNQSPLPWCYGTYNGSCLACGRYAPDKYSVKQRIDEVMVLLQGLTNGV
jgi:hypothetical protein